MNLRNYIRVNMCVNDLLFAFPFLVDRYVFFKIVPEINKVVKPQVYISVCIFNLRVIYAVLF